MFNFSINCQLQMGNAFELIKSIPNQSVDLILTDPPYNIGSYSSGNIKFKNRKDMNNDIAEWDHDIVDPLEMVDDMVRILKPTGNIIIFTGSNLFGRWHAALDPIFDTFQYAAWHKTNPTPSVRKSSFLNSIELIVCCWNKGHTWNFTTQRDMHNFIETPVCAGKERYSHPTQKPLTVIDHFVKIASDEGDVVVDPFMGTGTTGLSACRLNRNFIGFECDPTYFGWATERMSAYVS